jgi:hypothetical protein
MNERTRSDIYHHHGTSLYFCIACNEYGSIVCCGQECVALDLVVAIRLRLSASKFERISGIGSPKQDDVSDKTTDLTLESETRKGLLEERLAHSEIIGQIIPCVGAS